MRKSWLGLALGALLALTPVAGLAAPTAGRAQQEVGLRVAARQSLVMTLPAGVDQVSCDDTEVAEVVLVATGDQRRAQVLIHGRAAGSTRLILWSGGHGQALALTVTAPQEQAPASALQIGLNSFRIIKVTASLSRIAIGDESVAGVMVLPAEQPNERTVSLLIDGRAPGVTNILIWTPKGVDSLKVAVR